MNNNNTYHHQIMIFLMLLITWLLLPGVFLAEEKSAEPGSVIELKYESEYSDAGADSCLNCHDADSDFPATKIFFTAHGDRLDKNSPMAQLQCESCHGPAGEHTKRRVASGEEREAMISFNKKNVPVEELNGICSSCHKDSESHFLGSGHDMSNVACSDCHSVHEKHDQVQIKQLQPEVCGSCHMEQKHAANRFSTHPMKYEGQMGCTDCHAPHGSVGDHLLVAETVNDTCFSCHAEKRGPFVWEHEPATESCTNCHLSHGSNQPDMLVQRSPFLCQTCHSSQGHPSLAYDRPGINPLAESMMLGRSCANCHSQVHGSNHPSGSLLQR
jgi:DmsE family decaheme c-type cytochrome